MNVRHASQCAGFYRFVLRYIRSFAITFTVMMAASALANIRELPIPGDAIDQQRIQSAPLSNGWVVFVWEDQSGTNSEVRYRLFNPANEQYSFIRTANAEAAGDQVDPVIAPLFDGGFIIAFASRDPAGDYDVKFRRFDFTGFPDGPNDVLVNTTTGGQQQHPDITTLDNGEFVIAFSGPGGTGQDLFFRRFSAVGLPLDGSEIPLNTFGNDPVTIGDQGGVRVDTFPEGGWMAAFEDYATGELYGIRFSNSGVPYNDPEGSAEEFFFVLNEVTVHDQFEPALAAFGDEAFAVAFNSDTDGTAAGRRVQLRIFDSGGPGTGDIAVGDPSLRSQDAEVALINGPNLVVAWKSLELVGGSPVWSIYAQVFSLNGTPQGAPLFLHADQLINRSRPKVNPWLDGGFSVVWETGEAGGSVAGRTVAPVSGSPGMMGIALMGAPGAQTYQVSFLGFPGECYELQSADILNNWSAILTTNTPTGIFLYVDLEGAVTPHRFFRVKRKLSGL